MCRARESERTRESVRVSKRSRASVRGRGREKVGRRGCRGELERGRSRVRRRRSPTGAKRCCERRVGGGGVAKPSSVSRGVEWVRAPQQHFPPLEPRSSKIRLQKPASPVRPRSGEPLLSSFPSTTSQDNLRVKEVKEAKGKNKIYWADQRGAPLCSGTWSKEVKVLAGPSSHVLKAGGVSRGLCSVSRPTSYKAALLLPPLNFTSTHLLLGCPVGAHALSSSRVGVFGVWGVITSSVTAGIR